MIHILIHSHRFGESNYVFNTNDPMDMEVGPEYDWDDKNLNRLLGFLKINFEPEREEAIVIESFPMADIPDFDTSKFED